MEHNHSGSCCGCSHKGVAVRHWVKLRLAAVLLVPLVIWTVLSVVSLVGADHATFIAWLSMPTNAGLLGLFMVISCYHAALGVQEIIEDYVSCEKTAHCIIAAQKILFTLLAAACLLAIGTIAL